MAARVLLVDDSATARVQAGRVLTKAGFEVIEAVDGIDAFEKLEKNERIAIVVCDVNMPRMSGVEFVEELSTRDGDKPPVLMLTTEGHPQLVARANAAGASGWMSKPFKADALVETVKKLSGSG